MTSKKKSKRIRFAPIMAAALALVVAVGAFGGSAISARIKPAAPIGQTGVNDICLITAYAKSDDGTKKNIDLTEDAIVKTDIKLTFKNEDISTGSDCAVYSDYSTGFKVNSDDVKTVTYSADHGDFDFQTLMYNNYDVKINDKKYDPELPYASDLTITFTGKEMMEIYYYPAEAVDQLLRTKDTDYSKLPGDTITIAVEYNDGTTATARINTSFDKDGYMQLEYVK